MKRYLSLILVAILVFGFTVFPAYAEEIASERTIENLSPREKAYFAHRGYLLPGVNLTPSRIAEILSERSSGNYNNNVPSGYVQVTNIPTREGEELFFAPGTGLKAGSIYSQSGYTQMLESPRLFAQNVFKKSIDQKNTLYYLWGEWDDRYGTHQGVDIQGGPGAEVYSAHAGIVVKTSNNGDLGTVAICDGNNTHYYLHMNNHQVEVGDYVSVGDYIGDESNVGAGGAHLHYEYHAGEKASSVHVAEKTSSGLRTSKPYFAMAYSELR